MNILVIGCGKTGTQLCNQLSAQEHDVSVVDALPSCFDNLSDAFAGYTVTGVPIDQDVLRRAGVEACDAIAAVTEDDNMNLMVCQLAREVFHVPRVLARVYDPQRSETFRHFGVQTICPINLSVDAICAALLEYDRVTTVQLDYSSIAFDAMPVDEAQYGVTLGQLCIGDRDDRALFGVMRADGHLILANVNSVYPVERQDRLLYAKIID